MSDTIPPKLGLSSNLKPMHYSVGALIIDNGKCLLIDRKKTPFGFAGIAGHINVGEPVEVALARELKEETGLQLVEQILRFEEEVLWNTCSKGIECHYWYLYECVVKGTPALQQEEAKSMGWYDLARLSELTLEPVWEYWFGKLSLN